MDLRWIIFWCTTFMSIAKFPLTVNSDPIKVAFTNCQPGIYYPMIPNASVQVFQCCPPQPTKPIIDGLPPPSTTYTRVRKASQCTDKAYAAKLKKGYALMRALPDDDPRSFLQQWMIHCAYCGGSFLGVNGNATTGLDIHGGWLFYPWHRFYLYFHERILQSLLGDPTFSLNYWNWDGQYTVGDGHSPAGACLKSGRNFPPAYSESTASTYDVNRSDSAKGLGIVDYPDLAFNPYIPTQAPSLEENDLIKSNLNVMYQAMVSGGTTADTFVGYPQRAGDLRRLSIRELGPGSLTRTAHANVHFWAGLPGSGLDVGTIALASRDPVFFAHHANVDRLFQVWKTIGPTVGQDRDYSSDPDFLNTELLFYDENKDLRRVKVEDCLDTEKSMGFVYQEANDDAWIHLNQTRCCNVSYSELITLAESLPVPSRNDKGDYHLQVGETFIIVIERPKNPRAAEEFLTISGIKLDRQKTVGFDVFVDLLNPGDFKHPSKCAEYSGRFTNMARVYHAWDSNNEEFVWKQSISRTIVDLQAPPAPSKLVVTLVPVLHHSSSDTITFKSIIISV